MQHVEPCAYCAGVVTVQENRWVCTECGAEWTLGMRLLREGRVLGRALDDVLGPSGPVDDELAVDTLFTYSQQRYRVRLYRRGVLILTNLAGFQALSDGDAFRAVAEMYGLDDGTLFILHLARDRQVYMAVTLRGDHGVLTRMMAVEEVEEAAGIFLGDDHELAEAMVQWVEL